MKGQGKYKKQLGHLITTSGCGMLSSKDVSKLLKTIKSDLVGIKQATTDIDEINDTKELITEFESVMSSLNNIIKEFK